MNDEQKQMALDEIERQLRNLHVYSPTTRRRHRNRLISSRRRLLLTDQERDEQNERRRRRYRQDHSNNFSILLNRRLRYQTQRIQEGLPPLNVPINVIIT